MHSVRACILKHRLRLLSDFRSVLRNSCKRLSPVRCYGVASFDSPFNASTITIRPSAVRSSAQNLQTSCCEVYSHSATDQELTKSDQHNVSTKHSADDDCLDVEASNLHTPVLAKEVVDLIAPTKGQVSAFHSEWICIQFDVVSSRKNQYLAKRLF